MLSGRALWTMLLILCPLVGYSFVQAVALYAEASRPALSIPELARQLSQAGQLMIETRFPNLSSARSASLDYEMRVAEVKN